MNDANENYQIKTVTIASMAMPFTIQTVSYPNRPYPYEITKQAIQYLQTYLDQIDQDFSPFKNNSLVSRFQNNQLLPSEFTDQFQEVLGLTTMFRDLTEGAFDPYFDNHYDPTGLVKGWAIQHGFDFFLKPLLQQDSIVAIALNGAGDMQLNTKENNPFQWHVGIENPADPQSIIREITIQNGAIATSGFSKRGQHIKRISPDDSLTQATIIANELIVADVMATTAIAMERQKFEAFANKQNLHGLLITNTSQQINF